MKNVMMETAQVTCGL